MPTLSFEDINIHYEVHGSGPPLILHHGLSSSCQAWYDHLPYLTKRHQVIILDARGHGLSTAPAGDDHYSWEIMCDDLNRLMEHLGIEKAIVGGTSMGSGVCHIFALKYPQKVRALILSDSAGTGIHPSLTNSWDLDERDRILYELEERERIILEYGVVELARRTLAAGLVPRQILESEKTQQEFLERRAHFPVNGAIYATRFVMRTSIPDVERTKDLTMPTLIIIGEEDVGCLSGAQWLRDILTNRRYALLKEVGHGTSRYKPQAWRKAMEDFLGDLEQGKDIRGEVTL